MRDILHLQKSGKIKKTKPVHHYRYMLRSLISIEICWLSPVHKTRKGGDQVGVQHLLVPVKPLLQPVVSAPSHPFRLRHTAT